MNQPIPTARAYTRILKIARTIADLECAEDIPTQQISETSDTAASTDPCYDYEIY